LRANKKIQLRWRGGKTCPEKDRTDAPEGVLPNERDFALADLVDLAHEALLVRKVFDDADALNHMLESALDSHTIYGMTA